MAQRNKTNRQSPIENAVDGVEKELGRIQKQFKSGRRELEKQLDKSRKQILTDVRKNPVYKKALAFRKDTEKQIEKSRKQLVSDVQKNGTYKKALEFRKDAEKQIETGVENVLSVFQIASKRDLNRIDRRLKTLNKKLSEIEKSGAAV
jgi:hypothetical protein